MFAKHNVDIRFLFFYSIFRYLRQAYLPYSFKNHLWMDNNPSSKMSIGIIWHQCHSSQWLFSNPISPDVPQSYVLRPLEFCLPHTSWPSSLTLFKLSFLFLVEGTQLYSRYFYNLFWGNFPTVPISCKVLLSSSKLSF